MLSIKEIYKIGEKTYPKTMSAKGHFLDSQAVFDQAKAYVSLVEFIENAHRKKHTLGDVYLFIDKLKAHLKDQS